MPPSFVWNEYKRTKIIQRGSFSTIYKATRFDLRDPEDPKPPEIPELRDQSREAPGSPGPRSSGISRAAKLRAPLQPRGAGTPKPVAIKIATRVDPRDHNNPPDKEASFLRTLAHPHTITLIDTIPDPKGVPALILEYCPTDLFSLLTSPHGGDLPIRTYLQQILKGVAHFHANNTIHCDLKPENILINQKGILKICDFGFAETFCPDKPPQIFKGTLEFLSPEYIWDETLPHSPKTDVWSVGCIFYMLLTQKALPFATISKTKLFDQKTQIRYALESILFFLDPFPVQPSGVKPYPADLMSHPRKFLFYSSPDRRVAARSWKHKLRDRRAVSSSAIDLLSQFWEICPSRRISAKTALTHPFFC